MNEVTLKTWEDFEKALVEINSKTKRLEEQAGSSVSCPLFRGIGDSKYHLESTLDRIKKEMKFSDYITKVKIVHEHVATCTGTKWDRDINSKADHVSIFVYREYCGRSKEWSGNEPHLHTLGPSIATAHTHFLQQSEYLFCVKQNSEGELVFADYEGIPPYENQNIMVKYNIPGSERKKVLKKLDLMNITAYSLFGSEPSLMETLALREIAFKM